MSETITDLETTAYHEAGHTVACYVLKAGFYSVSIVPDKESAGRLNTRPQPSFYRNAGDGVFPDRLSSNQIIKRLHRDLLIDLAGAIASGIGTDVVTTVDDEFLGVVPYLDDARQKTEWICNELDNDRVYQLYLAHPEPAEGKSLREHLLMLGESQDEVNWEQYLWDAWTETKDLLYRQWPAVEAVAKALLEEREISGPRARSIIKIARGEGQVIDTE